MDPRHILPAAGTYLGSYPHPRIAKAFGLDVGMVYAVSAWLDMDLDTARLSESDKRHMHNFWIWELHWPDDMEHMVEYLCYARKHFIEQKGGVRDMDGNRLLAENPNDVLVQLDDYRSTFSSNLTTIDLP